MQYSNGALPLFLCAAGSGVERLCWLRCVGCARHLAALNLETSLLGAQVTYGGPNRQRCCSRAVQQQVASQAAVSFLCHFVNAVWCRAFRPSWLGQHEYDFGSCVQLGMLPDCQPSRTGGVPELQDLFKRGFACLMVLQVAPCMMAGSKNCTC